MPISFKQHRTLKYLGRVMRHLPVELMGEFSNLLSGTDEEWEQVEKSHTPWDATDLTRLEEVVKQLIAKHGHSDSCQNDHGCTCWIREVQ